MLFTSLMKYGIRMQALRVIDAKGKEYVFGDGSRPRCTVRLWKRSLNYTLPLNPGLSVAEAYLDGDLTIEDGTLFDFIEVAAINYSRIETFPLLNILRWIGIGSRKLKQYNPIGVAQKNVAHHYDLSDDLYDLFLDQDRQYSCAYFETPDVGLEAAQLAKKRHIAAKLELSPETHVLDIGCGWGGMALYIAQETAARVTGVTLSEEQYKIATERAALAGLSDRVQFRLQDYREVDETFDRIVSVGMYEHVGVHHYDEFAAKVHALLKPQGIALIHTIGRLDEPGATNPWIAEYIFPGGYIPALSEVAPTLERHQLLLSDLEVLRLHYASTLRHWRERFLARWDDAVALYAERFARMWDFYLAGSETSFQHEGMVVLQFQLTRQIDAVPLTRDYISDWERDHCAPLVQKKSVSGG